MLQVHRSRLILHCTDTSLYFILDTYIGRTSSVVLLPNDQHFPYLSTSVLKGKVGEQLEMISFLDKKKKVIADILYWKPIIVF